MVQNNTKILIYASRNVTLFIKNYHNCNLHSIIKRFSVLIASNDDDFYHNWTQYNKLFSNKPIFSQMNETTS